MSLETPTTQQIADNIVAQLEGALSQSVPLLPKAFCRVLAKALAAVFVLLFKYVSWTFLQLFVRHASARETVIGGRKIVPLVEWGRLLNVGDPLPAERAELEIQLSVLQVTGQPLPGGTQVLRPETGVLYRTKSAVLLDAPTKTVIVVASSDQEGGDGSGARGNLQPGEVLQFANPPPEVGREAVVVAQVVTGADAEPGEVYRARVLRRARRKPQGGAYADYQLWAEGVPGILNAYPYTGLPGGVTVYVEATVESSGSADGIPTPAQLAAVVDAIELNERGKASRRPVNAAVSVVPIYRQAFEVAVIGLEADDPEPTVEAIRNAVIDYLVTREPFIGGLSELPRRDRITQGAVAGVVMNTAEAEGATVSSVELRIAGVKHSEFSLYHGQKAKLAQLIVE